MIVRLVLVMGLVASMALGLRAQEPKPPRVENGQILVDPNGMDGVRHLLHLSGFEPVSSFYDALDQPENTIIILMGPDSLRNYLGPALELAVKRGASVLVACDQPVDAVIPFGVQIMEGEVRAKPADCYQHRPLYPFVRPIKSLFGYAKDSPRAIFEPFKSSGPDAIATMTSRVLRLTARPLDFGRETCAGFPFSAKLPDRDYEPARDFFAVGGSYGNGRALFLADHSVFLNRLVCTMDNGNLAFAENCINWLRGEEHKRRCLFVEDGVIRKTFALPAVPVPSEDLLELLVKGALVFEKHGDRLLRDREERDLFNKFILSQLSPREIRRIVLFVVTGLLLLVGYYFLTRHRVYADPARTLVTPELAGLIPHGNVLQQRFERQLQSNNVYESARRLVRDFLDGLDAEPDADGNPPPLEIKGDAKDSSGLRQRIMRLWQIGYGKTAVPIKPSDWPILSEELREILEDADNGWWKFVSVNKRDTAQG